ncbi:MAG: hypothetical protein MUO62_00670, partial [Anaerolineales bacterium]|nr:hypothetical protein [Anaerolineales bacterium]
MPACFEGTREAAKHKKTPRPFDGEQEVVLAGNARGTTILTLSGLAGLAQGVGPDKKESQDTGHSSNWANHDHPRRP